jgi:hypothetical protein
MNKDKKVLINLIIIIIILVVGGSAFFIGKNFKEKNRFPVVGGGPGCVVINSPKENDQVVGNIVKVDGYTNGCDNWTGDIGVAGEMYIKDENGNFLNDPDNAQDGNLEVANLSSWNRKYPVNFAGQVVIVNQPETKFGWLIINNENQSDDLSLNRKVEIKLDLSNVKIPAKNSEVFKNQSGAIKSITDKGNNSWVLAVDLLSVNPIWIPGVDSPYLNQSSKIRNLNVNSNTKTYNCENTRPDLLVNTKDFVASLQNRIAQVKLDVKHRVGGPAEGMTDWTLVLFDITGTNITAMYQQCLP